VSVVETGDAAQWRKEDIMGTWITIDVRDDEVPADALDAAFDWFRCVDATFSTYRPDSEIARLNRGEIEESQASPQVADVLASCRRLRERTGGAFDPWAAARAPGVRDRPGGGQAPGAVEPAAYVKGWSAAGAWQRLEAAGARNVLIDAGGDVLARGRPAPGRRWRIGIQHPGRLDRMASVVEIDDLAVATSGSYRRGAHIVDPETGKPPSGLQSVTCVGSDLAVADALSTAAFAMGGAGAAWLARQSDVEAMVITTDGLVRVTPGFDALQRNADSPQELPS
jgi:thiamine biosynthesis lipoprotein